MQKALSLAKKGTDAHPNPRVGAVLVHKGKIISQGFHAHYGGPHAEANAIRRLKSIPAGSTLYTTLEPCAHVGKTPPCADLILKKGIHQVVVGAKDPNPLVSGKGLRILKKAGVQVTQGVLEKEATHLNRDFNHWIRRHTPYVTFKIAQTLDGKIATARGESRWITGEESRRRAHELRAASDAVLVGIRTVLQDDPLLSVRHGNTAARPLKVILDSRLRTPSNAKIFSKESKGTVLIAATRQASASDRRRLEKKAEIWILPHTKDGRIGWPELLRRLGARGVVRLLIEGGGETIASALEAGVAQEAYFFIAPKIMGGKDSVVSVGGAGPRFLKQIKGLRRMSFESLGNDWMARGEF